MCSNGGTRQNLCSKEECRQCLKISFKSFDEEKVKCWDVEKNKINARQIAKNSAKKFWFNCNKCTHPFEMSLNDVVNNHWCKYCVGGHQ